jgi:uncharacterized HAD superfamily protein
MQKRIAFDIDGVLTENKYIPPELRTCENYKNLEPNLGVLNLINKLRNGGVEIVFITSRFCGGTKETTHMCFIQWLRKKAPEYMNFSNFPFYPGVEKENKARYAQSLNCDILVDDSIEAIAGCDDTVVKGMLFIEQNNRRYETTEYLKFMGLHRECTVIDQYTIGQKIRDYFKEAGIVLK